MSETIQAQGNISGNTPTAVTGVEQETAEQRYIATMRALKGGYSSGHFMREYNEELQRQALAQRRSGTTDTQKSAK